MKKVLSFLLVFIFLSAQSQVVLNMKKVGGVYEVPCKVNGLNLSFIFDTGASDVSISLIEALFMIRHGYLKEENILGKVQYSIANGDIAEGTRILLKDIEIGGLKLTNVEASIVHEMEAPLLLGQSAIQKLGKVEINGSKLTILNADSKSIGSKILLKEEIIFVWGYYKTKKDMEKVSGSCITYFQNGEKKMLQNFKNGLENGVFKRWNENGNLIVEGNYLLGNRDGEWKFWRENGQIKSKVYYKNGLLQKNQINCWSENGFNSSKELYILNYLKNDLLADAYANKEFYKNVVQSVKIISNGIELYNFYKINNNEVLLEMNQWMDKYNYFIDSRDDKIYLSIEIGEQIWMAENLAYVATGYPYPKRIFPFMNEKEYTNKYGLLYNWDNAVKSCPLGWHLPSKSEWHTLIDFLGGEKIAADKLRSETGWLSNKYNNYKEGGSNLSGFNALPAGFGSKALNYFDMLGAETHFWTASKGSSDTYYWVMLEFGGSLFTADGELKTSGLSVRCIKNK